MADNELHAAHAPIIGVGPRLKAAREESGLTLTQIALHTKIPERMLVLIEAGNFGALPARTYATGFTRSYARTLGLDEREFVGLVRHELGMNQQVESRSTPAFEPGDPARVPTAKFAWLAAVAALLVVAAGLFLWRTYYAPAVTLPPLMPDPVTTLAAPAPLTIVLPTPDPLVTGAATAAPAAPPAARPQVTAPRRVVPVSAQPRAPSQTPSAAPTLAAPAPAPASTGLN